MENKLSMLLRVLVFFMAFSLTVKAVPSADDPEAWKDLTKAQIEQVKQGKIVIIDQDQSTDTETKRFIRSAMIFNQPIEEVWKLVRMTETQHEYLPRLYLCKLVERHENWDKVDFFVKVLFVNIDYRVKHNFDNENYYMWWSLDPEYKNDLKHLEGYWKFYKLDDNHTLARYGTKVNTADFIPSSIQDFLTKKDLPESLEAVKKRIDSKGTYTKPEFKKK